MGGMDIAVVAFVVVVILVLFAGIKTVPQGYDIRSNVSAGTRGRWSRG